MKNIIESIKSGKPNHAGIPFWSWNDLLEKNELEKQIENMKEIGFGGFFMHARGGLETKYMSDDWFDAIKVCREKGKALGMEPWAYDEDGWPSGFAGGALLKDKANLAKTFKYRITETYPDENEDILAVYVKKEDTFMRVSSGEYSGPFYVFYREYDSSYVDILDYNVTRQFIALTHEVYKEKLGDDFGKYMPGFFTDEPQYFRYGIPWSETFLTTFETKYGYSVLEALPALYFNFDGSYQLRYDYYLLCHESYYANFMKPIYEWCDKNGIKLTGHGIIEENLSGQMTCCGGVMQFYRYEHIPGVDYLGRNVLNAAIPKQLGSVCEQLGKKKSLSEMFACCGWDVKPKELKRIADLQFANGVNTICSHLYAYSERGQRKRDYPLHYSEHNTWQEEFKIFENHFSNLGSALTQGYEKCNILVIHPMHNGYLFFGPSRCPEMGEVDGKFNEMVVKFTEDQIPYHFADEIMLAEEGKADGDKIVLGKRVYDTVILPYGYTIDSNTANVLRTYIENGGKLCLYGRKPDMVDGRPADLSFIHETFGYEQILAEKEVTVSAPLHCTERETESGRLIFLTNTTEKEYKNVRINIKNCRAVNEIDIDALEYRGIRQSLNEDGSLDVWFDFGDSVSLLIAETDTALPYVEKAVNDAINIGDLNFEFSEKPENVMPLDNAMISQNGGDFTEIRPIIRIRDNLLKERFEGRLTLRFPFEISFVPEKLVMVNEPAENLSVKVNGNDVVLSKDNYRFDRRFLGADIAKFVKIGTNYIDVSLDYYQKPAVYNVLFGHDFEAKRNCLSFDTEIENVMLYGDFVAVTDGEFVTEPKNVIRTKSSFRLEPMKESINVRNITQDGFAFFAGTIKCKADYEYSKGMPTVIVPDGRFSILKVAVNGEKLKTDIFVNRYDLADYLNEGKNEISFEITFSNRNLFGPFNRADGEMLAVGPTEFSFEGQWDGGKCDSFVPGYALVKSGI